jgi:hypothetical protein
MNFNVIFQMLLIIVNILIILNYKNFKSTKPLKIVNFLCLLNISILVLYILNYKFCFKFNFDLRFVYFFSSLIISAYFAIQKNLKLLSISLLNLFPLLLYIIFYYTFTT